MKEAGRQLPDVDQMLQRLLEVERPLRFLPQREPSSHRLAQWIKHGIHAHLLDGVDLLHQLSELPFWKSPLLEPGEIFGREVHNRHTCRWIFTDPELAKWHPGAGDFSQKLPEILAIDVQWLHRKEK